VESTISYTDLEISAGFSRGERWAFEAAARNYFAPVVNFTANLIHDRDRAVDLSQEAFFLACRAHGKVDPGRPLGPWLFQIARNLAYKDFNKRKKQMNVSLDKILEDTDGDGYMDGVEVESGYDPLKPAPGDKLIIQNDPVVAGELVENNLESDEENLGINLTEEFLSQLEEQKAEELKLLQEVSDNPLAVTDENILSQLQSASISNIDIEKIFEETFNSIDVVEEMDMMMEEDFVIMDEAEEDDEEKKKEIEKKQIEEYLVKVGFLLATNSPIELDESKELSTLAMSFVNDINSYVDMGNTKKLKEYKEQGTVIVDKLKEIEIPYVMKDLHIAGVSLFDYLINSVEEDNLTDRDDPMKMMVSLGRLQAVLGEFENLKTKTENLLEEYEINFVGMAEGLIE